MKAEPKYFYASVIDGDRKALLLGPYNTHEEAQANVERAKALAEEVDPWAYFYAFGTAGSTRIFPTRFGQ